MHQTMPSPAPSDCSSLSSLDDYAICVAQKPERPSPVYTSELEIRGRKDVALAIQKYRVLCTETVGHPPACMAYLECVPDCLPMTHIYVGQEAYDPSILPMFASAFAYTLESSRTWTPTVQVLGQAMASISDCSIVEAMHLASHSYLLITVGMLMINAYPYSRLGQFERIRISGYTAELVRAIVLASIGLGVKKVTLVEMGNEAQAVGDCAWASMKSKARGIRRVKVSNPVRIARSHPGRESLEQPSIVTMTGLSRAIGLITADGALGTRRRTDPWHEYDYRELSSLSPARSVAAMARHASWKSIVSLISDFENLLRRIITSRMSKSHGKGWQKRDEETENYVTVVMNTVVEMATKIHTDVKSCLMECEMIRSKSRRLDGRAADADSCIEIMKASAEVCATSASFLASLAPTLTSQTPAHSLSGTSVPGITSSKPTDTRGQRTETAVMPTYDGPNVGSTTGHDDTESAAEAASISEPSESGNTETGGSDGQNTGTGTPVEYGSAAFEDDGPGDGGALASAIEAAGLTASLAPGPSEDGQRTPRSLTPTPLSASALRAHDSGQQDFLSMDPKAPSTRAPSEAGRSYAGSTMSRRSNVRIGAPGSARRPRIRTIRS